jgi:hypothetical protein
MKTARHTLIFIAALSMAGCNDTRHTQTDNGKLSAAEQVLINRIKQSHLDGNLPEADSFTAFLKRDLLAFFKTEFGAEPSLTAVQYNLFSGPKQVGVGYPKFQLCVKAFADSTVVHEGVARIAAMNKTSFSVLQFIPKKDINEWDDPANPCNSGKPP